MKIAIELRHQQRACLSETLLRRRHAMGSGTDLRGRYRVLDQVYLRGKANQKDDPRHIFYEAMLSNNTYEAYLAEVGQKSFEIDTCQYRVTGRMEIRYARRNHRIANA